MNAPYRGSTEDQSFELPSRKRAGWWLMIVVGVGLMLLGAVGGAGGLFRDSLNQSPVAFFVAGTGMILAGLGSVVLFRPETAAALHLRPLAGQLTVRSADGSDVSLSLASLARCYARDAEHQRQLPVLKKRDGGVIELSSIDDDEVANDLCHALQVAIDAANDGPDHETPADPIDQLGGCPQLEARRVDGDLELSWRAAPARTFLPWLGPMGGMMCIMVGVVQHRSGLGTMLILGFSVALVGVLLWAMAQQAGVSHRVRMSERHLIVERRVGQKVLATKQIPLVDVLAIDYTHRLDQLGGHLMIRSRPAHDAPDADDAHADYESVPTGRLSLSERIALDLALSEELARRSERVAGQV